MQRVIVLIAWHLRLGCAAMPVYYLLFLLLWGKCHIKSLCLLVIM